MQVFAKHYTEAFGGDAFFQLVKNGKNHSQKLLLMCERMMRSLAEQDAASFDRLPDPLKDCLSAVTNVCSALACLLSPLPLDEKLSHANARSVQTVMKYTGKNKTIVMLKPVLKDDFWGGLWSDLLAKGSTTLEAYPVIQQLTALLAQEGSTVDHLMEALGKMQSWKGKLRQGAL